MKQQEKSEATRQLIIDTAYDQFYTNGLQRTSMIQLPLKSTYLVVLFIFISHFNFVQHVF